MGTSTLLQQPGDGVIVRNTGAEAQLTYLDANGAVQSRVIAMRPEICAALAGTPYVLAHVGADGAIQLPGGVTVQQGGCDH
jgi:hypothetical protein